VGWLDHELVVAFGHVMPFSHVDPFEKNIVVNQKPNKIQSKKQK
jgi:hypothetical protein